MSNNYSIGQQFVGSYTQAAERGDLYGLNPYQVPAVGYTIDLASTSVTGYNGIDLDSIPFVVENTNNTVVTQTYNASTAFRPAGYAWRNQANIQSNQFINQGYSFTAIAGKGISIIPNGNFYSQVINGNSSGAIASGNTIYILITNSGSSIAGVTSVGTLYAAATTPTVTNCTFLATSYVVINPSPYNVASGNVNNSYIVVISNIRTV